MVARSPLQHTCSRQLCLRFFHWPLMFFSVKPASFGTQGTPIIYTKTNRSRFLRLGVGCFWLQAIRGKSQFPKWCMNSSFLWIFQFVAAESCFSIFQFVAVDLLFALANWLQSAYRHEDTTDLGHFISMTKTFEETLQVLGDGTDTCRDRMQGWGNDVFFPHHFASKWWTVSSRYFSMNCNERAGKTHTHTQSKKKELLHSLKKPTIPVRSNQNSTTFSEFVASHSRRFCESNVEIWQVMSGIRRCRLVGRISGQAPGGS